MRAARWAEGPMNRTELLKNEIEIFRRDFTVSIE